VAVDFGLSCFSSSHLFRTKWTLLVHDGTFDDYESLPPFFPSTCDAMASYADCLTMIVIVSTCMAYDMSYAQSITRSMTISSEPTAWWTDEWQSILKVLKLGCKVHVRQRHRHVIHLHQSPYLQARPRGSSRRCVDTERTSHEITKDIDGSRPWGKKP
jgi:hypothetical protein